MKVYLNKYKNHWISPYTICEKICFWREIDYDEPWVVRVNKILEPIMTLRMKFLELVCPRIEYVKIDRWDTWSMDHTLALIVLPMLKQLQETKHGSPMVDDEDVPEELRSTDELKLHHEQWEWILKEMIWTFEQKVNEDADRQFFDYGEDYQSNGKMPWQEGYVSNTKFDEEGYKAWQDRQTNGMRLFGKYYDGLWD
mgnify:CR=1 FL=1